MYKIESIFLNHAVILQVQMFVEHSRLQYAFDMGHPLVM